MITIICGKPRVGKTALMTSFALKYMTGAEAYMDIYNSSEVIKKYNDGGFRFTLPKEHIVYSDYDIHTYGNVHSRVSTGFDFGLVNENRQKMGFYPPCSRFFFDESQKYYNSKGEFKLPEYVSRAFEIHGHMDYFICLAVQRAKLIDLNIRALAASVIEIETLKHHVDHGLIMSSTWTCRLYDNVEDAITNMEGSGGAKFKRVKYTFEGYIFNHYDSQNFRNAFIAGHENSDFDYTFNKSYGCSVDAVRQFNDIYKMIVENKKEKKNAR